MSPFLNPPMHMRHALINGGLPGEPLTGWVGAAEAKRLREVIGESVAYVAEVMGVPPVVVQGWEDGTLEPTELSVGEPPTFGLRECLSFFALALHLEKEGKGSDTSTTSSGDVESKPVVVADA